MDMERPRLSTLLATLACTFVVVIALPSSASAATLGCSPDARGTTDLSAWTGAMLAATNDHRTARGLEPLALDPTLTTASTWKARDLAVRDYFSHDDPADGAAPARSPWERLGDCGFTGGGSKAENIAAGQTSGAAFITAWINSPGHRANIENASMRYVGFGVARLDSSTYRTYAVQMFSSVPGPDVPTGEPPRTPQGGEEGGGTTPGPVATPLRASATVTRYRCRTRLAVRGWCWLLTVRGTTAASRQVAAVRRTTSGRRYSAGSNRSTAAGAFVIRRALRPSASAPRRWLATNATRAIVTVAATANARGALVSVPVRVRA